MNLTNKEFAVLRAIATNCFNHMNYGIPTCYEEANAEVWTNCINDAKYPSGLEGKALSGVCSSLVRKGLIQSFDETIVLTQKGYEAFAEGVKNES